MGVERFEPPKMVTIRLSVSGGAYPVAIQYNMDLFWDHPDALADALDHVVRTAKLKLEESR